jgi:hypothetical protein
MPCDACDQHTIESFSQFTGIPQISLGDGDQVGCQTRIQEPARKIRWPAKPLDVLCTTLAKGGDEIEAEAPTSEPEPELGTAGRRSRRHGQAMLPF